MVAAGRILSVKSGNSQPPGFYRGGGNVFRCFVGQMLPQQQKAEAQSDRSEKESLAVREKEFFQHNLAPPVPIFRDEVTVLLQSKRNKVLSR